MATMHNFDKDFVKRTKNIIENISKSTEYDVTLLLNCLLALVTLPLEQKKVDKYNKSDKEAIEFQKKCINKIDELRNIVNNEIFDVNNNYVINHIRNAIAHLHIKLEDSSYNNVIENVILIDADDKTSYNSQKYNFLINISVKNLKEFAFFVADEYLQKFFNI